MSTCDLDALSLFLDGELFGARHHRLVGHLKECSACREELVRLRHVDQVLIAWGHTRANVPQETEMAVRRSVQRRSRLRGIYALSRMMPAALGTSVAAALVLVSANLSPLLRSGVHGTPGPTQSVASSIKQQSAPLRYERGSNAVVQTRLSGPLPQTERHPQLNIY